MIQKTRATPLTTLAGVLMLAALSGACAAGAFEVRPEQIPALEAAAARSPQDGAILTQLGAAYHAAGRHEDARRTLERVVASGAADGAAYLYLGLANEELQDWSRARAAYDSYLAAGTSSRLRAQIRGRLAVVSRRELRQLAREALDQEALLSDQPPTPNSVAVMPFRLTGLSEELQPLQTALADMIITDLSFTSLRSVERVRVQSMIDEMVLAQAGYTTPETGARMGRLLRAEHVVQGIITGVDDQLALDASVLNTERRAGSELNHSGQLETIFDLQKQTVFSILGALGIVPTAQEREAITGNRTGNLVAFIAYGRGLQALDRGDYADALLHFQQATQLDPGFGAAGAQQHEAQQLTTASSTDQVSEIGVLEMSAVPTASMTQQIVDQVNYSPATTLTQTTSTVSPSQDRKPVTEQQQEAPVSQAARATVIIVIPRPTGSQP